MNVGSLQVQTAPLQPLLTRNHSVGALLWRVGQIQSSQTDNILMYIFNIFDIFNVQNYHFVHSVLCWKFCPTLECCNLILKS